MKPPKTGPCRRKAALETASVIIAREVAARATVFDGVPDRVRFYGAPRDCWAVVLGSERHDLIAPSRPICISKTTGEVLYDGSAGDEG